MTYSLISLPFLAIGVILAVVADRMLPQPSRRRRRWATAIAGLVLLLLTAVFDNLMIAAGLFGYADGTRLGPAIGLAPIEDLAYPIVAVLLVPAVWTIARPRGLRGGEAERGGDDED